MKEIKAYVRPALIDIVVDALARIDGLSGIAIVPTREYVHCKSDAELERIQMIKIEVDVSDDLVETVVKTILEAGRSGEGHPGDGTVLVSEIGSGWRISDGQSLT